MAFVHLHVHSQYSILDGCIRPADLVQRVAELEQPAVALTDRSNLYGAVEFYRAATEAGIHPVLGAEIAVQPEGLAHRDPKGPTGGYNLVFLVEDEQGYHNLCALITAAIFDGMYYRPRVDLELLHAHRHGLVVLTGSLKGPVGRPVLADDPDTAREHLLALREIFGTDHLYPELQDNALPGQERVNRAVRDLCRDLDLAPVVTNAVHYLQPQDVVTQQVLHAVSTGRPLDGREALRSPTDQLYLKSEQEMRELFPDDSEALDRTAEIADRCRYAFTFGEYHFPATTPPDPAPDADTDDNWVYFYRAFSPPRDLRPPDLDPEAVPDRVEGAGNLEGYFAWYAHAGLELRLRHLPESVHEAYRERLDHELAIISQMGFPAYLLIVAEFINWAKDHGIPVGPGRGSAAGSIAAWAMRITDVDPMRFTLLFERFLNPERVNMPDIDVDFCQDRREQVIGHVRDKYGDPLVSQIITYGKLQAKAAVRDVARVGGMLFQEADRVAKLIPNELNITLDRALDEQAFAEMVQADPKVRRVVHLARRIEGNTRQTGVHAAGVVIADRPLVEYAPLYRDGPDGGPVVQYDMKSAESIGLIKFDFLGLKTLDQIRNAADMVLRNTGESVDISRIPFDDGPTFELLCAGDALGVFQVESSGMRELLVRLRPGTIDEVIALIALYRPGPLQSGMVDDFIDRKHGRKPVTYPLPQLEPILESTYGVVLYQEQVMQIAQELAGYSLGEADLLRRAMGKKKPEEMERQKTRFLAGCADNDIPSRTAEEIFDLLAKFAGYGFNKSHSAAYGLISYQTAWLKAHYRAEYMAALMSIDAANTDKVIAYINDCRRAGIEVLPPDVQQSRATFDVPAEDRGTIRFGLAAVKAVGGTAVEAILKAREEEGGTFEDMPGFLEAIDHGRVNRRVLENLIRCGAFDWTGCTRRALMEGLGDALKAAQRAQEQKASGQVSLFGGGGDTAATPSYRFPDLPEWPTGRKLAYEKEALGFFISGHPLDAYGEDLDRHVTCTVHRLSRRRAEEEVRIAGMVTAMRTIRTKRGDRMAFVTLEDRTGAVECVFFSEAWQASRAALTAEVPLRVTGRLEQREDEVKVSAESAEPIADVLGRHTREIRLVLDLAELAAGDRLREFTDLLQKHRGRGSCRTSLILRGLEEADVRLSLPEGKGLVADDELRDGLESLFQRPGVARFL